MHTFAKVSIHRRAKFHCLFRSNTLGNYLVWIKLRARLQIVTPLFFMLFQHLCSLSLFPLFLVSSVLEISILSAKTKNAVLVIICIIFRVNKSVKCIIQLNTRENLFDPNAQWLSPIIEMVS